MRARYSACRCAAIVTRSSARTAGAPTAARRSLCTRSISAASFASDDGAGVGVGLGVGLVVAAVVAEGEGAGLAVGAPVDAVSVGAGDPKTTASCVASRPATASPTASAATSTNGKSVKAVRTRRMARRYGFLETVTTA